MCVVSEASVDGRGYRLGELRCVECDRRAALFAAGWRAEPLGASSTDELPALGFRCPDCAPPEFATSRLI